MARKKRRKIPRIVRDLSPPLVLGGGSIGSSILGGALGSKLPPGTINPLTTTGTTLGGFVGPVATISAFGIVHKQLKKAKPKLKGGKKR